MQPGSVLEETNAQKCFKSIQVQPVFSVNFCMCADMKILLDLCNLDVLNEQGPMNNTEGLSDSSGYIQVHAYLDNLVSYVVVSPGSLVSFGRCQPDVSSPFRNLNQEIK